jgi:3-dehydroquinate dehydratase-2
MIAVFNGANLNMLGQRDPSQYGTLTLSELESRVYAWAGELNLTARCHQSNHEGVVIDHIHECRGWANGTLGAIGAHARTNRRRRTARTHRAVWTRRRASRLGHQYQ